MSEFGHHTLETFTEVCDVWRHRAVFNLRTLIQPEMKLLLPSIGFLPDMNDRGRLDVASLGGLTVEMLGIPKFGSAKMMLGERLAVRFEL